MQALFNNVVIATSDDTVVVENNHYFPIESVRPDVLSASDTHTICPWKGTASYYSVAVAGKMGKDAAWFYPQPKAAAAQIAGRLAFWKGVTVREV
jgi:uncharacterized protein (DUF427 family)